MARLLDVLDIDLENVCRLCLGHHGVMTSIHDGDQNKQSLLSERILLLASVQILPDDGLPGLICHSCRDKVEKFVKFKEQVETSYFLLCQYIGIDPNETDSNYITTNPSTSSIKVYNLQQHKEKPSKIIKGKVKNEIEAASSSLSSLFKDHLVSGISDNDLLVNQKDNFINVNNISYINVSDDTDIYKNADTYIPISLSQESISDEQQSHLVKDISSDLSQVQEFCNAKSNEIVNDGKIYNITFPDNNADNLQDIFLELDNDDDTSQNGYEDISKFLKTSQGIDLKKLKEEYRIKDDNDGNTDVDPDSLLKKLANRGITLSEGGGNEIHADRNSQISENGIQDISPIFSTSAVVEVETEKRDDEVFDADEDSPDMILAKMPLIWREKFIKNNYQAEIAPRIVELSSLDPENSQIFKFKTYICHLCLIEFRECSVMLLKDHSRSHFEMDTVFIQTLLQCQPMFECEICAERFNERHLFVAHQRKHLNIKPFSCDICTKMFWCMEKLSQHMSRHSKVEPAMHPCAFCGKTFLKKHELKFHEKSHTTTAPLICSFCDKSFSNVITLKMHVKRHTEGTKHCCEICGKAFYSGVQLKRHEQFHSGFRKFPCNFCSKAFCSNAERKRHLLYHFKTKRFKCSECDKAFYESGHLTIHMRIHTNFKPFVCEVCAKGFPTRVKLMRHLTMHKTFKPTPSEIRDKNMLKRSMPDLNAQQRKVTPKFIRLNPTPKKDDSNNTINTDCSNQTSVLSADMITALGLENLQDNDEESYIIIEEGDDSNAEESNTDLVLFDDVQAFTDDDGQVVYVLNDQELLALNHSYEEQTQDI